MSTTEIWSETAATSAPPPAHRLEQHVYRELCRQGGVAYSSVVVRRLPNGVCLEGVIRGDTGRFDASTTALKIPGVREVLNHLVHCGSTDQTLTD